MFSFPQDPLLMLPKMSVPIPEFLHLSPILPVFNHKQRINHVLKFIFLPLPCLYMNRQAYRNWPFLKWIFTEQFPFSFILASLNNYFFCTLSYLSHPSIHVVWQNNFFPCRLHSFRMLDVFFHKLISDSSIIRIQWSITCNHQWTAH